MGDAKDAIDEAKRLNKQVAARAWVRVQEAQEAIAKQGDSEQLQTELAAAKYDYDAAMKELRELDRLAGKAMIVDAQGNDVSSDGEDYVQRALDNVRDHAANLDAQVKLADELAPAKPAPAAPPEDPDEAARQAFEALRAGKPKKTL